MYKCKFCFDRGCLACEGEIRKREAAKTEAIRNWRPPSEEGVAFLQSLVGHFGATPEQAEAVVAAAQMPPPLLVVGKNDLEALKNVLGADALEAAFSEDGGGMEEILERAEGARIKLILSREKQQ